MRWWGFDIVLVVVEGRGERDYIQVTMQDADTDK
jgi:hypothetical protein